jgi:hypothetical protein
MGKRRALYTTVRLYTASGVVRSASSLFDELTDDEAALAIAAINEVAERGLACVRIAFTAGMK